MPDDTALKAHAQALLEARLLKPEEFNRICEKIRARAVLRGVMA